jgi:hypothetical protein
VLVEVCVGAPGLQRATPPPPRPPPHPPPCGPPASLPSLQAVVTCDKHTKMKSLVHNLTHVTLAHINAYRRPTLPHAPLRLHRHEEASLSKNQQRPTRTQDRSACGAVGLQQPWCSAPWAHACTSGHSRLQRVADGEQPGPRQHPSLV